MQAGGLDALRTIRVLYPDCPEEWALISGEWAIDKMSDPPGVWHAHYVDGKEDICPVFVVREFHRRVPEPITCFNCNVPVPNFIHREYVKAVRKYFGRDHA